MVPQKSVPGKYRNLVLVLSKQGYRIIDLRIRAVKFYQKNRGHFINVATVNCVIFMFNWTINRFIYLIKMLEIFMNISLNWSDTDLNEILGLDSYYLLSHFVFLYFEIWRKKRFADFVFAKIPKKNISSFFLLTL